ncbi:hypothetical protein ACJZ2D_009625 [Fusarium nematophilum]
MCWFESSVDDSETRTSCETRKRSGKSKKTKRSKHSDNDVHTRSRGKKTKHRTSRRSGETSWDRTYAEDPQTLPEALPYLPGTSGGAPCWRPNSNPPARRVHINPVPEVFEVARLPASYFPRRRKSRSSGSQEFSALEAIFLPGPPTAGRRSKSRARW